MQHLLKKDTLGAFCVGQRSVHINYKVLWATDKVLSLNQEVWLDCPMSEGTRKTVVNYLFTRKGNQISRLFLEGSPGLLQTIDWSVPRRIQKMRIISFASPYLPTYALSRWKDRACVYGRPSLRVPMRCGRSVASPAGKAAGPGEEAERGEQSIRLQSGRTGGTSIFNRGLVDEKRLCQKSVR